MALADVVDLLACPACAARDLADAPLRLEDRTLRCGQGHAYDVARQGYVNLLGHGAPRNADTAAMVAARERFLATGAYDPLADALTDALDDDAVRWTDRAPVVLDVGSGPGWYLDRVLAGLDGAGRPGRGLALDVSTAAARRAGSGRRPVGAVVADAWDRLPVSTAAADVVLSVFAPRDAAELARVLAPGGVLLVASPLPDHLASLRAAWGLLDVEAGKQERLATTLGAHLEPVAQVDVRYDVPLGRAALEDLVAMGPNAFHDRGHDREPPGTVEVAVRVGVWRRTRVTTAG